MAIPEPVDLMRPGTTNLPNIVAPENTNWNDPNDCWKWNDLDDNLDDK